VRQQAVEEGLTKKLDAEYTRRKAAEERGNAVEQHAKAAERSAAAAAANLSATPAPLPLLRGRFRDFSKDQP
jgi:hypothetical protein